MVAGFHRAAETRLDDCTRKRANKRGYAGDFARDDSAVLRCGRSEEVSREQTGSFFGEHWIFSIAGGLRDVSVVAAGNLWMGLADCLRQSGKLDAGSRGCG